MNAQRSMIRREALVKAASLGVRSSVPAAVDDAYFAGFSKAAEAAGVDPVALLKYAQQAVDGPLYETGGYAPPGAQAPDRSGARVWYPPIPQYNFNWDPNTATGPTAVTPSVEAVRTPADIRVGAESDEPARERAYMAYNPQHAAWRGAHLDATMEALKGLRDTRFPVDDPIPAPIDERMRKIYHDKMYQYTNSAPARVTAPAAATTVRQ